MYKRKMVWGLIIAACLAVNAGAAPVSFWAALQQQVRGSAAVRQDPGMGRLTFMRYYFPKNTVYAQPGMLEKLAETFDSSSEVRAVAFYLYQMYVSRAAYGGAVPDKLNINYLGALDNFEMLNTPFDARSAAQIYKKHKKEVKTHLARFFSVHKKFPAYPAESTQADHQEQAFLRTLEASADANGRAGYFWASPRWKNTLSAQDKKWLSQILHTGKAEASRNIVLYKTPKADLSALDKTSGRYSGGGMEYLYRPADQECDACSYVVGRALREQMRKQKNVNWGHLRLYRLTARPIKGSFLQPARGNRFARPEGGFYPAWHYHAAILVIMNRDGRYTPAVLDTFLSAEPMAFSAWLARFKAADTRLTATPFKRLEEVEDSITRPDKKEGQNCIKDGCTYKPYPVYK